MSSTRERLEEILNLSVTTAQDAERAARAAEALAAYLRAEEQADRVLKGGNSDTVVARGSMAGLTLHEAAERVLEQARVPLHVRELGKRIKAGGWTHPRSARPADDLIRYQLAARLPKHPERFRRVAPNTFALSAWDDATSSSSRARRRLALFRGPGGASARAIGESPEQPAGSAWRSS